MDETLEAALLQSLTADGWSEVGVFPHHGITIALSSIYTERSCGIGEFYDLIPLIDWCEEVGFDLIQLLPINDCGSDPSPYNAISSCALNPIYLSLDHLPLLSKSGGLRRKLVEMHKNGNPPRVNFSQVQLEKMAWLREYATRVGSTLSKRESYARFVQTNPWLRSYALFKVLKDRFNHYIWTDWPKEMKELSAVEFERLYKEHHKEIFFYILLQYLAFLQLGEVKEYACAKKILLKGDIPILISPDSCDVWHHPHLFNLAEAAGAPPDAYNAEGQYWGFPIYRWDVLQQENYSWWLQRVRCAQQLYHLYRIDHVLGFFRIWAIPVGKTPKEGRFLPEDPICWPGQGKELLQIIVSGSSLLPIAEDLGALFPGVRSTLKEMGICGTRVMRWERYWDRGGGFIPLNDYDTLSMTTISTHDSETLSLWWRDQKEEAAALAAEKGWQYDPDLPFDQRKTLLQDSHRTSSLFHVNLLSEYLALFPEMVWPNLEDERINVPGTISATNWTYRFRLRLEEILSHEGLKEAIKEIIPRKKL